MNRSIQIRRHTRLPVQWPMLYGNEEFVAEGTVLDITAVGWRIAGPMPVQPGMHLCIQVSPPEYQGGPKMLDATVLWTKGCEYALSVEDPYHIDNLWLMDFLNRALGWWLLPPASEHWQSQKTRLQSSHATRRSPHGKMRRAPRWACQGR